MSLKSIIKGWSGEIQGTIAKKILLDSDIYIDVNNVTIPVSNGATQIDHVIVSRFGVFVVETKNMDGWFSAMRKVVNGRKAFTGRNTSFKIRCIKTTSIRSRCLTFSALTTASSIR